MKEKHLIWTMYCLLANQMMEAAFVTDIMKLVTIVSLPKDFTTHFNVVHTSRSNNTKTYNLVWKLECLSSSTRYYSFELNFFSVWIIVVDHTKKKSYQIIQIQRWSKPWVRSHTYKTLGKIKDFAYLRGSNLKMFRIFNNLFL